MKTTALALSALGFASLTAAQNGNDPLILNNRTGLAPVVYDSFTTSYTFSQEPVQHNVSVPLTLSHVRSTTFTKPTTSIQCWRDGYPCNHHGGQRSQRHVAELAQATHKVARHVPPPEFFSSRTDVPLPGQTDVAEETDGDHFDDLPIPTSLLGQEQTDATPQPTVTSGKQCGAPPPSSATSEALFSVLPISSTLSGEPIPIPTEWWRGSSVVDPTESQSYASPTYTFDCYKHYCPNGESTAPFPPAMHTPPAWMEQPLFTATTAPLDVSPEPTLGAIKPPGPEDPNIIEVPEEVTIPTERWRGPNSSVTTTAAGLIARAESTIGFWTLNCHRHYCTSGQASVFPILAPTVSYPPDTWSHTTSSHFAIPPDPTDVITETTTINAHGSAFVESVTPSESATIPASPPSSIELNSLPTSHPCFRHYCPSGWSSAMEPSPVVTVTTFETSTRTQTYRETTILPAVPPPFTDVRV